LGDLVARLRTEAPQVWKKMTLLQRGSLVAVAIATVAAIVFVANWAQQSEYSTLFSNLTESDAAAIVAKLKELKVPYELADGGTTVKVPSDRVYDIRLQMASQGLPKGGTVGFELFDKVNFGLTDFAQKLNYQRALEGELARTIASLSAVADARVHIVMPQDQLFAQREKPTTASVVVRLKPGQQLDSRQVRGVVNLVSRSVEGLKPENVTVLDGDGVTLSGQDDGSTVSLAAVGTQRDAQRSYERALQQDIQAMLEQVLGQRKAVVRVAATMDWDQHEASSETYSPAGAPTQIRSSREVVERSATPMNDGALTIPTYPIDGRTPAGPVPPSATPTVVATPQATPGPAATATAVAGSVAEPKYERREVTNNYEISKLTERTVKAPGSVKKLSVSVLLDGQMDDALTSTITKVVTAAAGLDPARGDTVVVASIPFDQSASAAQQKQSEEDAKRELYLTAARGAMVAVSLLVVVLLVRSLIKGLTRDPNAPPKLKGKKGKGKGEQLVLPEGVAEQAVAALKAAPKEEDPRPAQVLRDVTHLAETEPQLVAQIVKSWLDERG